MKKLFPIAVILTLITVIAFVPSVRKIFVPVAEIEEHLHLAPQDMEVRLKGVNVPDATLKELSQQKKVLFLNFWGSWCAPCVKEWPSIQKLYETEGSRMSFALVAMLEDEAKVRQFLAQNHYTAPVYLVESPLSDNLLPKVFPTTYLLDSNGRILMKETASKDWMADQQTKTLLNNLTK